MKNVVSIVSAQSLSTTFIGYIKIASKSILTYPRLQRLVPRLPKTTKNNQIKESTTQYKMLHCFTSQSQPIATAAQQSAPLSLLHLPSVDCNCYMQIKPFVLLDICSQATKSITLSQQVFNLQQIIFLTLKSIKPIIHTFWLRSTDF